jgi:hypothetical protein
VYKRQIEDLYEEGFELDEIIGYIAYRINDKFEGMYESALTEGSHGMATKLLQAIVDGDSSSAEGIKMSKELAQHYIDWIRTSPYGKKNANLPLAMLGKASHNWGIERGLDSKLKTELKGLKESTESIESDDVNEARSINKIQSEWTKVTNSMKDTAASWKAAEGDAKTALLTTLKEMTAKKKALEAELDAVVSDKDKDLELAMESLDINEAVEINEEDIKSDDQFKEYAMAVLKDAFKDEFDEAKANAVIKGILGKVDGDYGAAIGMLTSSLGESVTNEATVEVDATDPKDKNLAKLLKKHNVTLEVINKKGPSGYPEVKLTGDTKDLKAVLADDEYGWDDEDLADYIEESNTEN